MIFEYIPIFWQVGNRAQLKGLGEAGTIINIILIIITK